MAEECKSGQDWKSLGNKQFTSKQFENAIESYSNGIQSELCLNGGNVKQIVSNILSNRSLCNIKMNNFKQSLFDGGAALTINKNHSKSWYRVIESLMELGYKQQGLAWYDEAMKNLNIDKKDKSFKLLKKKLNNTYHNPNDKSEFDATFWCHIGLESFDCSKLGGNGDSDNNNNNISEKDNNEIKKIKESKDIGLCEKMNQIKEIGNKICLKGNNKMAIYCYDEALLLCENLCNLYNNKCATELALKQFNQSFLDGAMAIVLNNSNVKAWLRCGESGFELGNFQICQNVCQIDSDIASHNTQLKLLKQKLSKIEKEEEEETVLLTNTNNNKRNMKNKSKKKGNKSKGRKDKNKNKNDKKEEKNQCKNYEDEMDDLIGNLKKESFLSTDQVSLFDNFMSYASELDPKVKSIMSDIIVDIPQFDQLYPKLRGWPKYVDIDKCKSLLSASHQQARFIKSSEMQVLSPKLEMNEYDIVKRFGATYFIKDKKTGEMIRAKWYFYQPMGSVDPSFDTNEEFIKSLRYDDTKFHSFSNAPDQSIILHSGTIHIGIGFCDLRLLCVSSIKQLEPGPLTFIGVDMSAYTIAKTHVIYQMLKNKNIDAKSVLQVWYSATWTKGTNDDFMSGVNSAINAINGNNNNNEKVMTYLKHWQATNGTSVSMEQARKEWVASVTNREHSMVEIAAFKREDNILDMCEYVLTGDVLGIDDKPCFGNVTMFDNGSFCNKKAKSESVFHIFNYDESFSKMWKKCNFNLKKCVSSLLINDVNQLKRAILANEIKIELIHGYVGLENKQLISYLASKKAYSVSWNNCMDFIAKSEFHKMAKAIGNQDCVHFGYSMNWVLRTKGANILDFADYVNERKKICQQAKATINAMWSMNGMSDILRFPPMSNAINYTSYPLSVMYFKQWFKYFMDGIKGNGNYQCVRPVMYSPLHRINTTNDFSWTYDQDILFQPKVPTL